MTSANCDRTLERRVVVCAGTGCVANGAWEVKSALESACEQVGLTIAVSMHDEGTSDGVSLTKSGCQGFCQWDRS